MKASENNPIPINPSHRKLSINRFSSPLDLRIIPAIGVIANRTITVQYTTRLTPEISNGAITLAPTYPYRMVITNTTIIKNTSLAYSFSFPSTN
jgi:hypothetical protein